MKKIKVFNVEFDGIDKCGKDSVQKQIHSVAPNKYTTRARGLLSQIAFAKMFSRDYDYVFTDGYIDNTLFVYLTVDEDDWKVRCDLTHEHEINKGRADVEGEIKYKPSVEAFDFAFDLVKSKAGAERAGHFMVFNTSKMTPIAVIKAVVQRLEELNEQ